MIIDTLSNAATYQHVLPGLEQALAFLRGEQTDSLPDGRYELDGDRIFALVQTYETKAMDRGVWEAHRAYADVQYVVDGRELLGFAPLSMMSEVQAYDAEKDVALYEGQGVMLPMEAGMFALLLPQDVHRPGMADGEAAPVRKVVVKIRLSEPDRPEAAG